jgi:hypothetical protein
MQSRWFGQVCGEERSCSESGRLVMRITHRTTPGSAKC